MKRLLAILVALMLLAGSALATPDPGLDFAEKKDWKPREQNLMEMLKDKNIVKSSGGLPLSEDVVTVDVEGRYHITANGITCSVLFPFGWYVFTQDFLAQMELYLTVFQDPLAVYTSMMESGQHLLAIGSELDGGMTEMYMYQDAMSMLFGNLSEQEDVVKDTILAIYARDNQGAQVERVQLGDHEYFSILGETDDGEIMIVETIMSGFNVRFHVFSRGEHFEEEELEDFRGIIESVQLS